MNSSEKNIFESLKNKVNEEVKKAYIEGTHKGAIVTVAIIYDVMQAAGLEENNTHFLILKDIAKQHGCNNLKQVIEEMKAERDNKPNNDLLS